MHIVVSHRNKLLYKLVIVVVGVAGQGTLCLPRHRNALSKIKSEGNDPSYITCVATNCVLHIRQEHNNYIL